MRPHNAITSWFIRLVAIAALNLLGATVASAQTCGNLLTLDLNGSFGTINTNTRRDMQIPVAGVYYYGGPGTNSLQLGAYVVVSQIGSNDTHPSTDHWQQMYGQSGAANDAFLAVNGATSVGIFFKQDLVLVGGQTYRLSGWGANAVTNTTGSPEIGVRLRNSGGTIVTSTTAGILPARAGAGGSPTDTKWVQAAINYTPSASGVFTIEYYNVSTASSGNDFGIDSLSVNPLSEAGCPRDYGDAPDTAGTGPAQGDYQTLLASGGPRHNLIAGLFLGNGASSETNGQPNATATGDSDDALATAPAISSITSDTVSLTVNVENETGETATLRGFLDFNRDGDFLDTGETASVTVPHQATSATLSFTVPAGALPGSTIVRLRLALVASEVSTATGTANSGEVEDYLISIRPALTLRKAWANATISDAITLSATGLTPFNATANNANETDAAAPQLSIGGSGVTVSEVFTTGSAASYATAFVCTRNTNGTAVTTSGSGASYSLTMPNDSSVTCTLTNTRIVPLSVTKSSVAYWDPVNGSTNPKMIPGGIVTYTISVSNPGTLPTTADSIIAIDPLPTQVSLVVGDINTSGSGPIGFSALTSGLTYSYAALANMADDLDFSGDGGTTWTKVPALGANNADTTVTHFRIRPKGAMAAGSTFSFIFRALIK